jgi:hypothetical protein
MYNHVKTRSGDRIHTRPSMCISCTAARLLCDKVQRQTYLMPTVGKRCRLGKMEIFIFATVICTLTSSVTVPGQGLSPYSLIQHLFTPHLISSCCSTTPIQSCPPISSALTAASNPLSTHADHASDTPGHPTPSHAVNVNHRASQLPNKAQARKGQSHKRLQDYPIQNLQ